MLFPRDASNVPSNSEQAAVLSALGTLIGYIGAEAATSQVFERLLWPQRFWNGFSTTKALKIALFMPMGGPLHRAALHTLDKFFERGLFKGDSLGHMLGTAFYTDTTWPYKVWNAGKVEDHELVRNGLWPRAAGQLPIPVDKPSRKNLDAEIGLKRPLRARTCVSRLALEYVDTQLIKDDYKRISNDTNRVSCRTYIALFVSETTGIITGIVAAVIWQTWFACLWFIPLFLKLVSALFAICREGLSSMPPHPHEQDIEKSFEIHHPQHGIFVIEGKESVVLQFFRHYGHPIRSRVREVTQFIIVVCFGLNFSVGLVASIIWMPLSVQYLWLGYQLYATLAMYIYRYADSHRWATTEENIATGFHGARDKDQARVYLDGGNGWSICATLSATYHNSFGDAEKAARTLLDKKPIAPSRCDSELTLLSSNSKASTFGSIGRAPTLVESDSDSQFPSAPKKALTSETVEVESPR